MKWLLFLLTVILFFSCNEEKVTKLSYVEESFIADNVFINMPYFKNGFPFIEEDSIEYFNIYLLNDSTLKLNDTIIILPRSKKIRSQSFGILNRINDSIKYLRLDNYILNQYLDNNIDLEKMQVNLFLDTSISYEFYHEVFLAIIQSNSEKGKLINILGKSNTKIETRFPFQYRHPTPPLTIRTSNILEILCNNKGNLMIENELVRNYSDISQFVISHYTNPLDLEWLPRMIEYNQEICMQNIAILQADKPNTEGLSQQKFIQKNINEWNNNFTYTKLIGPFRKISKGNFIAIQLDAKNSINDYLRILDSVNGAILSLRNEISKEKFHKLYTELNPKDSLDKLRKEALDFVYPIIVNPAF